jgi:cytochrome c-type biogenesis protein
MPQGNKNNVFLYPLMLGGAFSLASTPCSTPILGGIMAYASFKANILAGGLMLFLYALGQSVIIIFAGLFTAAFKKVSFIKSYSSIFTKVCGVVLILASGFLYLKMFNVI